MFEQLSRAGESVLFQAAPEDGGVAVIQRTKRILIADDDEMIGRSLSVRLRHAGFEVEYARDGSEAEELAFRSRPDLILLDVFMPKMSGLELLARIAEHPRTRGTPVIALTASKAPGIQEDLHAAGVRACFEKPFDSWELLEEIGREL